MSDRIARKWRPSLWAVVSLVLGLVLCLPIAGLFLFKFYANQLVQQTEESLLTQAAVLSATYVELYANATGQVALVSGDDFDPQFPSLSMNEAAIQPPRPDAIDVTSPPSAVYQMIGPALSRLSDDAQRKTLAGYRFVDPQATVIGGTAELGKSLSQVHEITAALRGETISVARTRVRSQPEPFLYDLSRGTRVRVFVAMPAVLNGQVIGAVYISRTPNHIFRFLHGERFNLAKAGVFVLLSTGLIGIVFWRFITRPIHALITRSQQLGQGNRRWKPLDRHGTREIAELSQSFQDLTERLQNQRDALKSYTAHVTHELKSPLTAVKGAAELLRDPDMSPAQHNRFLDNIDADLRRIEELLASMRAFSLAEQNASQGLSSLNELADSLRASFAPLAIDVENGDTRLPLDAQALQIVLTHLLENAAQHGAEQVSLQAGVNGRAPWLRVSDNGSGISPGNLDKILTPFFTTRRDHGGTGMGLNIVQSIVLELNGSLLIEPVNQGASFYIQFGEDQTRDQDARAASSTTGAPT